MSTHSIADAQNQLPQLIGGALAGEPVVITHHYHPVVAPHPASAPPRPAAPADSAWRRAHRVGRRQATQDAGTTLSRGRDEAAR